MDFEDSHGGWLDAERSSGTKQHCLYRYGVLFRFALVNKQWFHEAARVLWRDWTDNSFWYSPFTNHYQTIEPIRRQFYGNFIRPAELLVAESDKLIEVVRSPFQGISFPNLKMLYLRVPGTSIRPTV